MPGGATLLPGSYPTAAGTVPLTSAPATTGYGAGFFPSPAVGFTPSGQATTAFGAPAAVGSIPSAPGGSLPQSQPRRPTGTVPTNARGGPFAQPQYNTLGRSNAGGVGVGGGSNADNDEDYSGGDYSAIPGVPGVDYPVYAQVPRTNFDCSQQPLPGYYADIEAQCQVFHICALNRTYSFLCPNGTVFSQETLVCVWWNQYDCVSAPSLYANNAYIYDYGTAGAPNTNPNVNANAYQVAGRTAPATTAYGANISGAAVLRPTGVPQVSGFVGGSVARGYVTPSATPTQTQPQFGAVIRPAGVSGTVATPGVARGAVAGGVAPENREYLPPAAASNTGRRQRAIAV
ncbi:uncharacterized protein LOC115623853 [Scaptodrosophila lebanonensis]|uniref:Uncharacterized protein LOC115623853 n=1 Tax=Drosophila lebanonensis TaxID=7225 RepID=A0A6J2TGV1_DROLE|nr:uncharacterized protein LOC115623853 [Scaptodrosophila lebanonensis]